MANRRCFQALLSRYLPSTSHYQNLNPIPRITHTQFHQIPVPNLTEPAISNLPKCIPSFSRKFCSNTRISDDDDDDEDEDEEDDDESFVDETDAEIENVSGKSDEEKAKEAEEIGYKVVGPLQDTDRLFKPYEPVFAVVQIGSHQFKVSNRDSIFVERLKYCDVNDKLILNQILMLGSETQTIIGRPILPDAAVHAVVEEHALDAKVIVFKKKRRKNYRRTKGHRQELTKLRITDIQGIEKPEPAPILKTEKKSAKKAEAEKKILST